MYHANEKMMEQTRIIAKCLLDKRVFVFVVWVHSGENTTENHDSKKNFKFWIISGPNFRYYLKWLQAHAVQDQASSVYKYKMEEQ